MASSCLSNDQQNFECVTIASVDFIKLPLKDILENHIQPVDIGREINSCPALLSGKFKLRQDQQKYCLPPPPAIPDYSKFDVTLLYTLIRNLCPSLRPTKGWGKEPDDADIQIGDDIERLRLFRNHYYAHANSAAISEVEFKDIWKSLKLTIRRIQSNTRCSVDYKEELLKIEYVKSNHDHLEDCKRILEAYLHLHRQTNEIDGPEIFIKGEDRVICGLEARFEASVKNADLSCWQITWELEKHTENVKKCIDTSAEKYSDSTKEILYIKSVCKDDEGKYQAILSQESIGTDKKVSSNNICLHVIEGTSYQTEVLCHIFPRHGLQRCLLKVYLRYLIKNLKNPDETWTKEKILQHIENAMCTLEKNNEIKLFKKFVRRLQTDKDISKTLMKCGEDFVAMLFSFKQRYNARNILLSEGSLCVTFCFDNDLTLETFMRKIVNNDIQLTKDFSRIILNKTLLNIFNIDPQQVWWTANTAKIYLGLQCFETGFLKPIEGFPEDFTSNEMAMQTEPNMGAQNKSRRGSDDPIASPSDLTQNFVAISVKTTPNDQAVPSSIPDVNENDFSNWKHDDKLFVEIHSFPAMLQKVKNQAFVTFVGVQGSGKTATARHIALKLQEEGHEIVQLQARNLMNIETHCNPNIPQVFVIDDMLGMFEFEMSMFKMLDKYKYRITNPKMIQTKALMTCREEVFRNDVVLNTFLSKKENVVFMHSQNNALTDGDINELLYKYNLDYTESILTTKQSKMFPKICKAFSKRKEYMLPTSCILEELDEMKTRNKTYYASLVLLMAYEKMSKEDLDNENQLNFEGKKAKLLRACEVSLETKSSDFVSALSEMDGIYTKRQYNDFYFLNLSIFEITAYHFGCQFPELILQYMSGSYIADYINLGISDIDKITEDVINEDHRHSDTTNAQETVKDLCIDLQESEYPLLGARLLRDVLHGEECVLRTKSLKHPIVLHFFIEEMARMSYSELFFVFLSGLKETHEKILYEYELTNNVDKRYASEIRRFLFDGTNTIYPNKIRVRFISFVIYYGHHQILQCIIEQMIKENKNVDDLFRNLNTKVHKRYSDKGDDTSYQIHSQVDYDCTDKFIYSSDSEGDYNTTGTDTDSESDSESRVREKHRLLSLACYSGDVTTVQILLSFLNKESLPLQPPENIYAKPLEIASQLGYIDIVIELVKCMGDVEDIFVYFKPLFAACKEGHLDIVKVLTQVGACVNPRDEDQNPLIAACHHGLLNIVKKLIKKRNLKVKENTPLNEACHHGYWSIAELKKIKEAYVNQKVKEITPLIAACYQGHLKIVEELIKYGADINQKVTEKTPLIAACQHGHFKIVDELMINGADVNQKVKEITPLIAAYQNGHLSIVKDLINMGANVNQKVKEITPLEVARLNNNSSSILMLLKRGANEKQTLKENTPLNEACHHGHLSVVEKLIKNGADVNLYINGISPLRVACLNGHYGIEVKLIQAGAKVIMDVYLYKHLTDMCYKGHLSVVKELIKAGADVNQSDGYQKPLVAACIMGHLNIVEELIKHGASVNQSAGKETPLTAACGAGHLDIVQALIHSHADVNNFDSKTSPLRAACDKGHMCIFEVLVKAGANVNLRDNNTTPLTAACHNVNLHVVKELIKAGADVNKSDGKETPLNAACSAGDIGVVKELIHAGANVNINVTETTPLIAVCDMGYWDIVGYLIKVGACVNQSNTNKNPLIAACQNGHLSIVEELIKNGADVNQKVKELTPLFTACQQGYLGIVEELIKNGADVNQKVKELTPLFTACQQGYLSIVEELTKNGADVNQSVGKETPLSIACGAGQLLIVKALIKAGVNVNFKVDNKTPLKIAIDRLHFSIVQELNKAGAI